MLLNTGLGRASAYRGRAITGAARIAPQRPGNWTGKLRMPMKKWLKPLILTIVISAAVLAAAFTILTWFPFILGIAEDENDKIEKLTSLLKLAVMIGLGLAAIAAFIVALWKNDKPEATVTIQALRQLRPLPANFTGRKSDLKELREAIVKGGVTISGLQGQGGVGKTALALKLAHEIAPRYPDAQIDLDLKGVSEKPLTTGEAMAHVIRSFQRDPNAKLPDSEAELSGLYLSVLHQKRVLLLMDNARDAAQVKPLIPPAGCALLVTSRHFFTLQGLHPKRLDTLAPTDARALLLAIAPRIKSAAEDIAKLCGYLPLALDLAARTLAEREDLTPAEYVRRLADETNRPKMLAAGNESVEASINLSYSLLDTETQKRWRTLGVFPDTFDVPAAAAVWAMAGDNALDNAGDILSRLRQFSMLEWTALKDGTSRYHMHDLMRDFARARMESAESTESALRHAAHYMDVLAQADDLYLKGGESVMRGLALFDLEWGNIQAGQAWAAANAASDDQAARICSSYPNAGVYCLALRQHSREQIRWLEAAIDATRKLQDRKGEGSHLGNLGNAYDRLGETRKAIGFHEQALAISLEIGDRKGEGNRLGNLGIAYASLGETRKAIECAESALKIFEAIEDPYADKMKKQLEQWKKELGGI